MLTIEQKINKPVNVVFDNLSNMDKFVKVHPIIYKIDKTAENYYLIHEKLKFLFIPVRFKYTTLLSSNEKNKTIQFNAKIYNVLKIEMTIELFEAGTQTQLRETVKFKTVLPITWVLKSIFKKQHHQLFLNIENN